MTVGEKIKTFRTIRGISQNVLGELAGIDGTTIRKYELGSRKRYVFVLNTRKSTVGLPNLQRLRNYRKI